MAVISITEYKSIMTDYNTACVQLEGISDEYYNAAYTVLINNVFDPEIDLLVSFHLAYVVSQSTYASAPTTAIKAVTALQNHILNQSVSAGVGAGQTIGDKYDEVDDFYADNPVDFPTGGSAVIPQGFATMSQQAGHTIGSTYIVP